MSRTNTYLINGLKAAADLRGLLSSELAAFYEDGKITLTGPEISLNGERAVALALVINELTTNAAKYGCLSCPAGSLRVDWQIPEGGKPILRLVWREADGPAVAPQTRNGFGSGLISRSLVSYGGSAELDFHVTGVTCAISLPLA
jgi:two-component sensor histidine kinase